MDRELLYKSNNEGYPPNKCYYHKSDFDGICSGEIVKYRFPDVELVGVDYSDDFHPEAGDYVVDISTHNLHADCVWIDHHKAAFDKCPLAQGIRRSGTGACELTWEYLFPDRIIPWAVSRLAEYDVWDFKSPDTLPFQYGLRSVRNPSWELLFDDLSYSMTILSRGEAIIDYHSGLVDRALASGWKVSILGREFLAVNGTVTYLPTQDLSTPICNFTLLSDGRWRLSLRGRDVLSEALALGGGGHPDAAGATVERLPW